MEVDPATLAKRLAAGYLNEKLPEKKLLSRLKKLEHLLSEHTQDNAQELDNIAAALKHPFLLKHPNNNVKLYVALCLADIFRIYAPDAPYDADDLAEVFKHFVSQLAGLDNPKHPSLQQLEMLLERLVTVKAFILISDDEEMFLALFRQLFTTINEEQSGLVQVYFLDIMLTCLETSSSIPAAALELILVHVLGLNESGSPCSKSSHALAKRLLQQGVRVLEPAIAPMLSDILLGNINETVTNLHERIHDTIYKLQQVAPELLITVLPHLERELGFEDLDVRKRVVELLAKLFAEYPHLHSEQFSLYNRFIGRFKDIDSSIRCILVEFAKFMILRSSDAKVAEDLSKHLLDRLRDQDENVRGMAVDTVIEIATESNLDKLPRMELLEEVVIRMRDRRPTIREKAVSGIAALWSLAHEKWDARKSKKQPQVDGSGWNKERRKFFDAVPVKVFFCYALPDADDKMRVEELLGMEFCPNSLDPEVRSQRLLNLYHAICTETGGRDVFRRYLHDKKVFRQALVGALDSGSDKVKVQRCRDVLAAFVSGVDQLTKISNDEGVVRSLRLIAGGGTATHQDVSTSDKKVKSAVESVTRIYSNKGTKVKGFVSNVISKASIGFVDRLAIVELVGLLQRAVDDDDEKEINQVLSLIEDLSSFNSSLFAGSAAHSIMEVVKTKTLKAAFADRALKVLSNVSAVMGTDAADELDGESGGKSKKTLFNFVVKGTPSQAKWAVRSLLSGGAFQLDAATSIATDIVSRHLKSSNVAHMEALYASLRQIAKSALGRCIQKDSLSKELKAAAEFAINTCLKMDNDEEDSVSAKLQAVGFLGQYCVLLNSFRDKSQQSPNPKANKSRTSTSGDDFAGLVVHSLQDLLSIEPSETDEDATLLCGAAASAFLKMTSCKPLDSHVIPLDVPIHLCSLAASKSVQLRRTVASKISKRIADPHSPLKYLAVATFYGAASDKEMSASAKKAIHFAIDTRRRFKRDSEDHLLEQVDRMPQEEGQALLARTYATLLPEYAVSWLVHLIAHQDWFSRAETSDDEDQIKSALDRAAHVLHVLIDNLCSGVDNYNLLRQMLLEIKLAKDVQSPESTGIQKISEIANLVVERRLNQASKSGFAPKPSEAPAQILLPAQLYANPDSDSQQDGTSKKLDERSFIPKSYMLPSLSSEVAKTIHHVGGRKAPSKRKRVTRKAEKRKIEDEEEDDMSDSESESHSASRSRSATTKPSSKRRKTIESDEEEDETSSDSDRMDIDQPITSSSKSRVVPRRAAVGKAEEVRKTQKQMIEHAKKREKQAELEANATSSEEGGGSGSADESDQPRAPAPRTQSSRARKEQMEPTDAARDSELAKPSVSARSQPKPSAGASKRAQPKRTTGKR